MAKMGELVQGTRQWFNLSRSFLLTEECDSAHNLREGLVKEIDSDLKFISYG